MNTPSLPFPVFTPEQLEKLKPLLQEALDKVMAEFMEKVRQDPELRSLGELPPEDPSPRTLN